MRSVLCLKGRATIGSLLFTAVASVSGAADAPSATVTVSAAVAGRTPAIIGYNMGDNLPGSNVTSWLRYSGLNGARFWWAQEAWPAKPAAWSGAAAGFERFESERARLRADGPPDRDRAAHAAAIAQAYGGTPAGTIGDCHSLSELRRIGAEVLVMMSGSRYPLDTNAGAPDWSGRWAYWRGIYLNALYVAQHYEVARFQLFNEPDHSSNSRLSQPAFIRRLQLGSDAVQAALADVNRRFGRSLRAQVSAPVSAGLLVFNARSGRPDTRDAQTGWGELLMRHRHDDFPGRSEAAAPLFHTYAFQNYGREPDRIMSGVAELRGLIARANGGVPLPIIVSEMNVSTAANFAKTADTLDTPSYYAAFGAIAAAYAYAGLEEVYVFRLTQTANLGGGQIKKNGTHFLDESDPRKNILGSTKGAEAVRLFMRGFAGGRTRFAMAAVTDPAIRTLAARDDRSGGHFLLVTNLAAARTLTLDLRPWNFPANALVQVEEVSAAHHGDVRFAQVLGSDRTVFLALEADSLALVSVFPGCVGQPVETAAEKAGSNLVRLRRPAARGGVELLAVQTTAKSPLRVRVYGGAGDPGRADLLGQITLGPAVGERLVDVSRWARTQAGPTLEFRLVPDNPRAGPESFELQSAALRAYPVR
jgi:hypothetical protein